MTQKLYIHNQKLETIDGFPEMFVKPLRDLGIITVKNFENAEVSVIARCVYDQRITAADQANEPIEIGADTAYALQQKFRYSKSTEPRLDARANRYVYRAQSARTIVLKRTMTALINDGQGGHNREIASSPISVEFKGGRNSYGILELNPRLAKNHGLTLDQLRDLLESHSQFESEFYLVSKPDEDHVIQGSKGTESTIRTGARASGDV